MNLKIISTPNSKIFENVPKITSTPQFKTPIKANQQNKEQSTPFDVNFEFKAPKFYDFGKIF